LCEGIFKMPQADLRLYTFWVIIATAGLVFCLLPLFFLDFSNNRSKVAVAAPVQFQLVCHVREVASQYVMMQVINS
jgi:hypothetical protein